MKITFIISFLLSLGLNAQTTYITIDSSYNFSNDSTSIQELNSKAKKLISKYNPKSGVTVKLEFNQLLQVFIKKDSLDNYWYAEYINGLLAYDLKYFSEDSSYSLVVFDEYEMERIRKSYYPKKNEIHITTSINNTMSSYTCTQKTDSIKTIYQKSWSKTGRFLQGKKTIFSSENREWEIIKESELKSNDWPK